MMKIKAAVVQEVGQPYDIQTVDLIDPRETDVLIRIVASGICRSDYGERNGNTVAFPNVLGHEGSGIVEKVGPGVTAVEPGDHVILSYGYCQDCQRCSEGHPSSCVKWFQINNTGLNPRGEYVFKQADGTNINSFFNQSSFATHVINSNVDSENLVEKNREITGGLGCNFAIDTSGVQPVMRQALECLAKSGTFIPLAVTQQAFEVNTFFDLVFGNKKIIGCLIGDAIQKYHLPRLVKMYQDTAFHDDTYLGEQKLVEQEVRT